MRPAARWAAGIAGAAAVAGAAVLAWQWDAWVRWPALRAPVLRALVDPESARWRDQHERIPGMLCGAVNARTTGGGYKGFRRFISDGTRFLLDDGQPSAFLDNPDRIAHDNEAARQEIALWKSLGTKPMREDLISAAFAGKWAKHCGPS